MMEYNRIKQMIEREKAFQDYEIKIDDVHNDYQNRIIFKFLNNKGEKIIEKDVSMSEFETEEDFISCLKSELSKK